MANARLIICFDGTWNTPDNASNPTNVVKLLRAIPSKDDQIRQFVFYDKGVGTTGGFFDKIAGGLFGDGLTANLVDGYRFLANNWQPGDEVYIFGFSRGAYTARSLAGFLGLCGMISPANLGGGLENAIEIYRKTKTSDAEKQREIDALKIERDLSARIKCIGVWDTVGSLGVPGDLARNFLNKKLHFHDVQLSDKVDVALHAVAIDEKRDEFAPTLWVNDTGVVANNQVVEQVWFAGVHSNVGGSYKDSGLSDVALDWMLKRVMQHTDLVFDPEYIKQCVNPDFKGKCVESRSALYISSKIYPYQRLVRQVIPCTKGLGGWFRNTFKRFSRRSIQLDGQKTLNEMLHVSTLERWQVPVVNNYREGGKSTLGDYRPVNLVSAIQAQQEETISLPVVGWDGAVMSSGDVPWPMI